MALRISSRSELPSFMVMDVLEKAERMTDLPKPLLRLEMGQPSSPPPKAALDAIINHVHDVSAHGYTLSRGTIDLTEAIARHYKRWYNLDIKPDQVLVTVGSSLGFMMAFLTCFEAGDKIAMTSPGYSAYRNLMLSASLEPMLIDINAKNNWRLTVETLEQLDDIPDGLIIASPSNPTGVVITGDELAAISRWCEANGVRLISDEIYHGISFDKTDHCALQFSSSALVMNSFSKYFAMTGHRIGWIIAPDDLVDPLERLAQNCFISANTLSQIAATAALDDPATYREMDSHVDRYRVNRDLLIDRLPKELLGNFPYPEGGFYIYADTSALTNNSQELTDIFLNELYIATTPGLDFDDTSGHLALRFSFAGSTQDMAEAAARLNTWMQSRR
jgi:aspartate/methionine/tyrosine aminotransferase